MRTATQSTACPVMGDVSRHLDAEDAAYYADPFRDHDLDDLADQALHARDHAPWVIADALHDAVDCCLGDSFDGDGLAELADKLLTHAVVHDDLPGHQLAVLWIERSDAKAGEVIRQRVAAQYERHQRELRKDLLADTKKDILANG